MSDAGIDNKIELFLRTRDPLKAGIALIAGIYFLNAAQHPETWRFLDNVNLIIHEAGHTIFFFLGEFVRIAMGSAFQVLVPLVFFAYFVRRQEFFSAFLVLFWVGQSVLNVSVYAADAEFMKLPLLGGDSSGHDWRYLLGRTNLLGFTDGIALFIRFVGLAAIIIALTGALCFSVRNPQEYMR